MEPLSKWLLLPCSTSGYGQFIPSNGLILILLAQCLATTFCHHGFPLKAPWSYGNAESYCYRIIAVFRGPFASYGLPQESVLDKGPQFTAIELARSCQTNVIWHIRSGHTTLAWMEWLSFLARQCKSPNNQIFGIDLVCHSLSTTSCYSIILSHMQQ